MTAMKQRAIGIIEQMPDEQISYVITFLEDFRKRPEKTDETRLAKSRAAYQNLQKYRKKDAQTMTTKKK